jgi:hypothetical protein
MVPVPGKIELVTTCGHQSIVVGYDLACSSEKTLMSLDWGWRQNLSYRRGYIEAKRRAPFSCPWWADEEVCELGFLHGGNFLGAVR